VVGLLRRRACRCWACLVIANQLGRCTKGIGSWVGHNNIPVGWAFGIINFVWWIGIGHAGTLISAILLLLQQKVAHVDQPLRRGDGRCFAVICALLFPLLHTGRPWFAAYWLMPVPQRPRASGRQFKEPAWTWDVFPLGLEPTSRGLAAVSGSWDWSPDLAALRDLVQEPHQALRVRDLPRSAGAGSGPALGRGTSGPTVLPGRAVDAAGAVGAHHRVPSTFATCRCCPAGTRRFFPRRTSSSGRAVFSGFAMVLTWMIPAREFLGLKHVVTPRQPRADVQGHARHRHDGHTTAT